MDIMPIPFPAQEWRCSQGTSSAWVSHDWVGGAVPWRPRQRFLKNEIVEAGTVWSHIVPHLSENSFQSRNS